MEYGYFPSSKKRGEWENGLYSVNNILNKHWLASSKAGSVGGTTRQEVEERQWKQENPGKEEAHSSAVLAQSQKKQDVTALMNNVLSHMANTDKNNELI